MNKNIIDLEIIKSNGEYLKLTTTDDITIERIEDEIKKTTNYHSCMPSMEIIINDTLDVSERSAKDIFNIINLLEESYDLKASIALMKDVRCNIEYYELQWDNYIGFFDSEEEYCKNYIENSTDIPKHYKCYIDYQLLTRDMFCNLTTIHADRGVYVFHA